MVHGELPELSPLEATTHQGVCCAGVAALKYAASQVQLGKKATGDRGGLRIGLSLV